MAKRIRNKKNIQSGMALKIMSAVIKLAGFFIILGFFTTLAAFWLFTKDLPRPERFGEGFIPESTKIFDRSGKVLLYELASEEKRTYLSFDKISPYLKKAILVTEDDDFYKHRGIDLKSLARAIIYDLKLGQPAQGASTLSQQLIRTYFLTKNKTLKRKTQEIVLTLELERRYPKDKIFEWYLNLIPFGSNIYGVESASRAFFKKSAQDISLAQAATLAGVIKAPTHLWPYGPNLPELMGRKTFILTRMQTAGIINPDDFKKANEEKIEFAKELSPIKAPHFVMFLKERLEKKYGGEFLTTAGWKIYTTLDMGLQEIGETLVNEHLETLKSYNANNAALVAINPKNGDLLAMVGSKDYFASSSPANCEPGISCHFDPQTNVATSLRQPGSAFKPIVYVQAFMDGYTPSSMVDDSLTEFNPKCPPSADLEYDLNRAPCYHPQNYDGAFKGLISFRSALAQSRNVPAVKVLEMIGLKKVLALAKELGINSLTEEKNYGLALVLGGGEVKLLEITAAYTVFANDGIKSPLNYILKIEDKNGNQIESSKKTQWRVLPAQAVRQLNSVLSDNEARAPMFGYNSPLFLEKYQAAAKTGTTQKNHDAWCVGYTPNLTVGVWAGNNDNAPMTKAGGVFAAAPIWKNFMLKALSQLPRETFPGPGPIKK